MTEYEMFIEMLRKIYLKKVKNENNDFTFSYDITENDEEIRVYVADQETEECFICFIFDIKSGQIIDIY